MSALLLTGCQAGYLIKSSYHQLGLLLKKKNFERALQDPRLDAETKRKIKLVQEVKEFAEKKIKLSKSRNYDSFVLLDDRYVTYVLTASPKDRLEAHTWSFPIVGKVPYKGYFEKEDAEKERENLEKENLDVAQRGVSAYSTLGWFADPLLSSMTTMDDEFLVETIIHELTHATVYIKSNADFNEQLATFVGEKGMEEFYFAKDGSSSQAVKKAKALAEDSKVFSKFISKELKDLEDFYTKNKNSPTLLQDREKEFARIKKNFATQAKPLLKTNSYHYFGEQKLNNALLLGYKTYYQDLHIFQQAFDKLGRDWNAFIKYFVSLDKSENPEKELREFLAK